jgi:hypothetical protein
VFAPFYPLVVVTAIATPGMLQEEVGDSALCADGALCSGSACMTCISRLLDCMQLLQEALHTASSHPVCARCLLLSTDLTTADPKYALDGLYAVLGLLLGVNTLNERRALAQVLQDKQQQVQQLQQQEDAAAAAAAASSGGSAVGTSSGEL